MSHSSAAKNILICGGYGFIGSNFIRHLYHKYPNYKIINFDLLTYAGNPNNLKDIDKVEESLGSATKRYYFVKGDICDTHLLGTVFEKYKPEIVVNFAAESHVDRSIVSSFDFIRTNIDGVWSLLELSRKFNTPRFIQISTDEIYGSVPTGSSTEDSPFRPSNPYAASKASADLLVQSYIHTHRVPAIIVRGSNNFGPYQYPEKLIPLAITNILENNKVPIHGTGQHTRSWLHVKDFCSAIDLIAHKAPDYSIYNVSGSEKTNLQVLEAIASCLRKNLDQYKEHVSDRPGADLRYSPNSSKIKNDLGWKADYLFEDSIGQLVSWYVDNQFWWEGIKATNDFQNHYSKQSKAKYY